MWHQRLNLGTYFRIGVHVHWSFALLVAYIGYAGFQDGLVGTLFSIAVLLGMFFCVTLHEYGHALMARRFGIETLDITLFPIGGVARLMKIPRVPWQEFLVAVAGPAVNVAILVVLFTIWILLPDTVLPSPWLIFSSEVAEAQFAEAFNSLSWKGYMIAMIMVNSVLILFNMIPAFPMDGGRVLRSVLAMLLEYRKATRIASNIGIVCAVLMAIFAIQYQAYPAGLVAIFICYAGITEARHVDVVEPLRGYSVAEGMIVEPPTLLASMPLEQLIEWTKRSVTRCIPVVDEANFTVGMITISDVVDARRRNLDPATTCGELARHDIPVLPPYEALDSLVPTLPPRYRQFPVTDFDGRLLGLLDLDSVQDRLGLQDPHDGDSSTSEAGEPIPLI
ncbi:site-2 protease family protein [Stieleria sp. JC731]|uniref:site-2 protease family protein n=1 Tax=Roseiconus sp. JC912 TaxID=3396307 RepID=UPI003A4C78FC|nr:site-2 protease family protein [Stieleria sp. JC731]